jgi:aspartate aminotransferase
MIMVVSQRIAQVMDRLGSVARFFTASAYAQRVGEPGICDFAVGNPHELALPGFVEALGRATVPQNSAWFGYKNSEPEAREIVAAVLRERRGLPFEADDILLTNGAFAALAVVLGAIVDPGDEVIFLSPPWFFYGALIAAAGAQPVRVKIDPATFDLDLAAIEAAITPAHARSSSTHRTIQPARSIQLRSWRGHWQTPRSTSACRRSGAAANGVEKTQRPT